MTVTNIDAHLEVNPESVIEFLLPIDQPEVSTDNNNNSNGTQQQQQQDGGTSTGSPKATMTLKHPDPNSPPIAFKVKTTQPRRYLVRPNQGLIMPGQSEIIQILLVEKDKSMLVQSYQKLGTVAFDHTKDKFLVQSVAVLDKVQLTKLSDYEQLSAMWTTVTSSSTAPAAAGTSAVANKKLSVKFTVMDPSSSTIPPPLNAGTGTSTTLSSNVIAPSTPTSVMNSTTDVSKLTSDQLIGELHGLRRKYDELVSFSVNLTAERDILNNTLEQTKRDLNRQIAKAAANDNSGSNSPNPVGEKNRRGTAAASAGTGGTKRTSSSTDKNGTGSSSGGFSLVGFIIQILLYVTFVLLGAHLQQSGHIAHHVPFVSTTVLPTLSYLIPPPPTQSTTSSRSQHVDDNDESSRTKYRTKEYNENSHRIDEL